MVLKTSVEVHHYDIAIPFHCLAHICNAQLMPCSSLLFKRLHEPGDVSLSLHIQHVDELQTCTHQKYFLLTKELVKSNSEVDQLSHVKDYSDCS